MLYPFLLLPISLTALERLDECGRLFLKLVFQPRLAGLAGAYLMIRGGTPIIIIGILSIACGFLYTAGRFSLSYTGLADLFVLVFFGLHQ